MIAAEFEKAGITTVVIQFLRQIAEKVRPPRALCVPFKHGFPLGEPNNAPLQENVIRSALEIAEQTDESGPVLRDYSLPDHAS